MLKSILLVMGFVAVIFLIPFLLFKLVSKLLTPKGT